jgi:hypothetical protein
MSQSLASSAARAARAGAIAQPASPPEPGRSKGTPTPRSSVRRPPLRVVQAPPTAGSPLGFAMICAALLGAGLIALLLLNTAVAQDSFGLQRLKAGSQQLTDQKQALTQNNDLAAAPAQLSARAWSLGLVPASGTAFLQLPTGKVLGVANPAARAKPPTVITSTNGTTSTATTSTRTPVKPAAPVIRTGPVQAPAGPVAQTGGSGAAPGLAPAAPPSTTGTTRTTGTTPTATTTTR